MNRIIFSLLAFVSVTAWAQEPRDSTESVKQFVELQEVVIRGGLPNTRLKAGSMITRIEGTPLAQSGTLGEMLVMVPGMTGTDDSPEVLGKGSPLIYINGRKMRDASELKRLRSEDIRDVEVINNPGAQYDAQVLTVVRIRTRKQQGEGLSLHLTAADEHDLRYNFERPQLKLGANYRTGDIDVFGSLYYFHQDHRQYSTLWDKTMTTEKTFLQQGPYTMTWKNDHLTYTAAYSVSLGKVQTALSYSIKTDRPSFFAMNDAVTYISRYTLQAGNSQLLNERLRELTLNLSYRWLTLTASYERTKNAITQWTFIDTDQPDATLVKHVNLDKPINTVSAYLALTPSVGIWSLNATAGIEKQDLYLDVTSPQGTYRVSCEKPRYTLNAFNTFTLKHGWRFDVNLMYRSSGYTYNFYNDTYNLRLGLVAQKSLLKDRSLALRCAILDCLQHNRVNESGDLGYNQFRQTNRYSTHKLYLTLSYRLNATRSKYKGTGAGKETQERISS